LDFVKVWIIASATCTLLGWVLSAVGELNATGYLVGSIAIALAAAAFWWRSQSMRGGATSPGTRARASWQRLRVHRFRRGLPLLYLIFVLLACLGGALYAPNNYDALTYRLPRILHWWAAGHWYWIPTPNLRMNYSATGFEWLMLPLLTVTLSDRSLFLINLISYLLLPGLVFTVFRQLGVAPKVAWYWMWLIPSGFCFALQAGGIGNDAYAAVYALAAIDYSLRAVRTQRVNYLLLAVLSAALLTGAKASNIPLVLCALLVSIPAWRLLRRNIPLSFTIGVVALLVSFAPIAVANKTFAGDWTGDPSNNLQARNPAIGVLGNTLELVDQSLQPPLLPYARQIQSRLYDVMPTRLSDALHNGFPKFAWALGELPQEETAGLGLGITLLIVLALCSPVLERTPRVSSPRSFLQARRQAVLVSVGAWLACLTYMAILGSEAAARLLSPYYPLLILPLILHPANTRMVARRWWKYLATVCAAATVIGLILSPSRPLWPAKLVIDKLVKSAPNNGQVQRIDEVYRVYSQRDDLLAPLRAHIPSDVRIVGFIAGINDSELALWRPIGQRRVVEMNPAGGASDIGQQPTWIVVKAEALREQDASLQAWLDRTGGVVVHRESITSTVSEGAMEWDLVKLPS
jgi:hypothetical protein